MRSRRARWLRIGAGLALASVLIWLVGGYFVVVRPLRDQPTHADAVIVLGPVHEDHRYKTGVALVSAGLAPNLVVSIGKTDTRTAIADDCDRTIPGVAIHCFVPDPGTTRGEAEELRRLVAEHHWTKVIVVTSTYHISRARFIFRRCFAGTIEMVSTGAHIGLGRWAYQYLYQTVGYLKAFTQSGC